MNNDPRFLLVDGLPYHEMSVNIRLTVTRTPLSVIVNGQVSGIRAENEVLSFQASADTETQGVSIPSATYTGKDAKKFLELCSEAQEHMQEISDNLRKTEADHHFYLTDLRHQADCNMDRSYLMFMLASRPVGMTRKDLQQAIVTVSSAIASTPHAIESARSDIHSSMNPWFRPIIVNAMREMGIDGRDTELVDRFLEFSGRIPAPS